MAKICYIMLFVVVVCLRNIKEITIPKSKVYDCFSNVLFYQ